MAFALWRKRIRCPNCQYEGKAKIKGTGCAAWLVFLALLLIGLFAFWPLLIVCAIMFLWLLLKPALQICPKCKYQHPVPL